MYRKSDSAILVMKTAEDRLRCDDAEALNRARERGIFAQRAMNSRLVVISGVGFSSQRKWASPKTTIWSTHSRRIDPSKLHLEPWLHGFDERPRLGHLFVFRGRKANLIGTE